MQSCKERWKNIRTVFLRHLRKIPPSGSAQGLQKKYYLEDALQFLVPFVKSGRKQTGNLTKNNDIDTPLEESTIEFEETGTNSNTEHQVQINNTRLNSSTTATKRRSAVDMEQSLADYFEAKRANVITKQTENADQKFLLSLLPDIELMNSNQKRKCKLQFLEVIDKILQDNLTSQPCLSRSSSVQSTQSSGFSYDSASTPEPLPPTNVCEPSQPIKIFQRQSDNYYYNFES